MLMGMSLSDVELYLHLETNSTYFLLKMEQIADFNKISRIKNESDINKMSLEEDKLFNLSIDMMSPQFNLTKNKLVIITIGLKSQEELSTKNDLNIIFINKQLYEDVMHVLKTYFYPFIYIYEITGNNFTLIINADWTYPMNIICCTIAVYFIQMLTDRTSKYCNIKCGITYGKAYYGTIGNKLRMYGNEVILSAKLEQKCNINKLVISKYFHDKMMEEFNMLNGALYYEDDYIKHTDIIADIGKTTFYFMDLSVITKLKKILA